MKNKKWIKIFITTCIIAVMSVVGLNYIIDPLGVLGTNFLPHQFQINKRITKIEFLQENHGEFNSYMFGSSRIGTTLPSAIEKYIPSSRFYNFSIPSGNFFDYITHLQYFLKMNYDIKNVYLQIDVGNMGYFGNSHLGLLGRLHPLVTDDSLKLFYVRYLTNIFPLSIKGKIELNIKYFNKNHTEKLVRAEREKRIIDNCQEYQKSIPSFNKKYKRIYGSTNVENTISALKAIKKLSIENNINLYVFTTPANKNMMDNYKINDYLSFLEKIASVTDFYDFSGYNSITINNCNYYEYSHYRPLVGDLIAARIFTNKDVDIPNDFGILVTKDNIDAHLANREKQLNKLLLSR